MQITMRAMQFDAVKTQSLRIGCRTCESVDGVGHVHLAHCVADGLACDRKA